MMSGRPSPRSISGPSAASCALRDITTSTFKTQCAYHPILHDSCRPQSPGAHREAGDRNCTWFGADRQVVGASRQPAPGGGWDPTCPSSHPTLLLEGQWRGRIPWPALLEAWKPCDTAAAPTAGRYGVSHTLGPWRFCPSKHGRLPKTSTAALGLPPSMSVTILCTTTGYATQTAFGARQPATGKVATTAGRANRHTDTYHPLHLCIVDAYAQRAAAKRSGILLRALPFNTCIRAHRSQPLTIDGGRTSIYPCSTHRSNHTHTH